MIRIRPQQWPSTWAEDRALLRSNPSAVPGAKTGVGAEPHGSVPLSSASLRDWHQSAKPSRQDAAICPTRCRPSDCPRPLETTLQGKTVQNPIALASPRTRSFVLERSCSRCYATAWSASTNPPTNSVPSALANANRPKIPVHAEPRHWSLTLSGDGTNPSSNG